MKSSIHPKYYQATVTCNCFYTGTQKTAAAKGRIDKFNKKYGYSK